MTTDSPVKMTHRQVLEALTGLLLGMFVSMIATTVVSTSMPVIVHDLGGDQAAYTWVITATLLTTAISTPIWGKLADLFNRKLLIQIAIVIFVGATAAAGFAQDTNTLIAFRAIQGIGGGGLAALSQVIMADIISPRERGRYMGLFGAVMAVATVGGRSSAAGSPTVANWRWNFFVALPFAVAALIILQKTLHISTERTRKVSIDYVGIVLLSGRGVADPHLDHERRLDVRLVEHRDRAVHGRRRDRLGHRLHHRRAQGPRAPHPAHALPRVARSPCRCWHRSRSASRCSAPRCTSRSTCSSPVAPRRPRPAS